MLLILELQLPCELSVTYKKKKKSATFGGNYFFSTGAESAFERPKHSHKLIFDSVKLQPITTWKQYHKIYSFRHGMALIKSSVEFLNLTEACLFSFQILPSLHDHPFYTGQTTHVSPLLHPCSSWISWRSDWQVHAVTEFAVTGPFNLTFQFNSWTPVHDSPAELNSKAAKECVVTL